MPDRLNLIGFTELEKETLILAITRLKEDIDALPASTKSPRTSTFFSQLEAIQGKLSSAHKEAPKYGNHKSDSQS